LFVKTNDYPAPPASLKISQSYVMVHIFVGLHMSLPNKFISPIIVPTFQKMLLVFCINEEPKSEIKQFNSNQIAYLLAI